MPATKYTYSISTDFPAAKVAPDRLTQEIQASPIVTALDYLATSGDDCDVWFKDVLSVGDELLLDGLVSVHSGDPLPTNVPRAVELFTGTKPLPVTEDGFLKNSPEPRDGAELILVTHNFADPTSWYSQSARSENEALADSGDGLTWTSAHGPWTDMTHGKIFDEDALCLDVPHGYAVVVTSDGAPMTERAPFADAGGDYTVDYSTGAITFAVSQAGKDVRASYSYENGSMWKLEPLPGKRVDIELAEVQFSVDAVLNDAIQFEIWGYNPADLPNKMMYGMTSYKKMVNYIDEAIGSYPVIMPVGGPKRGIQSPIYGFPFRYGTVRKVVSSHGIELRVRLANDQAFGGEHATATLYCTSKDE